MRKLLWIVTGLTSLVLATGCTPKNSQSQETQVTATAQASASASPSSTLRQGYTPPNHCPNLMAGLTFDHLLKSPTRGQVTGQNQENGKGIGLGFEVVKNGKGEITSTKVFARPTDGVILLGALITDAGGTTYLAAPNSRDLQPGTREYHLFAYKPGAPKIKLHNDVPAHFPACKA